MPWLKPLAHSLCIAPLLALIYAVTTNNAGPNPVEFAIRDLGEWALRFILIALAVTPLRKFTGWAPLMTLRRMLGLWAFFYVTLHLTAFWGADLMFSFSALWREILKRPYITVGMAAFILLIPLAVTSTQKMIKRLGGARWRNLHKLVYIIGGLGVLHFYWVKSSKNLITEPLIYGGILAILLLYRVADHFGKAPRLPRKARA